MLDAIRLKLAADQERMVIRFRNPKLERMHSGNLCIRLTDAGTWESFEAFANQWLSQIDAHLLQRFDSPSTRVWHVLFDHRKLALVYDDYPNGVSVEAINADSNAALEKLFSAVVVEAVPDGV